MPRGLRINLKLLKFLAEQDCSDGEIAHRLGINRRTVWQNRNKVGVKAHAGCKREVDRHAIKEMLIEGDSVNDIADVLGIHVNTVTNIRKELGITKVNRKEWRRMRMAAERDLCKFYDSSTGERNRGPGV